MDYPVLKANNRQIQGKGDLKKLRETGYVPAIVYGKDFENQAIAVDERDITKIIRSRGISTLIGLEVENDSYPVMMKEIQANTIKNTIDHVDFFKVSMDEEVEYSIPIVLVGEPEGAKHGGAVQQQKRDILVKALPLEMLENIEVDISHLDIGDNITLGDIEIPETQTVLDDSEELIVSILAPSMEEEEEEETEEMEEPELVGADEEESEEE